MDISDYLQSVLSQLVPRESDWKFVTSAGANLSFGTPIAKISVAAEGGALWVKRDSDASPSRLTFGTIGGTFGFSLVPSPVNFSFSIPEMPSAGTVYKLFAAGRTLTRDEFSGAVLALEFNADVGAGFGGSLMFLGGSWFLAAAATAAGGLLTIPALIASSTACVRFGGMTSTLLPVNVSVGAYIGYID